MSLPRIHRFTLLERIAEGGMGELHAAYDGQLDRKIALKLVRPGRGGQDAEARLLREAQALAKLSHPNVVTVYEVGVAADHVFVAMEYVHGKTLTAWLAEQRGRPEPERVAELLARFGDAGRGLAAVHRAGLAHRDFKPDNVLVGTDGRVRVVDFGLARSMVETTAEVSTTDADAIEPSKDQLDSLLTPDLETKTGTVLGTPRYMAPEQWRARRGDSRSDQFSFCVALYWALFASWPFVGEGMTSLRAAVIGGDLREPPRKPEVPARLHAALLRGLASEPEDRFPDMTELLAAIDETLAPKRRHVGRWLGLATLTLVGVGVITLQLPEPAPLMIEQARIRIEREIAAERRRDPIEAQVDALSSAGEIAEADAVFEAFARQREYAGTRALARAWLDQAGRLRERGEQDHQLAALGEAQLASPSADLRRQALIELARVFVAEHRYDRLAATLTMLEQLDALEPHEPDEPALERELIAMHLRAAASRRDFASALELLREPGGAAEAELRPLLDQLARARRTPHVVSTTNVLTTGLVVLASLDRDGDQRGDLVVAPREGPLQLLGSSVDLPVLQTIEATANPGPPTSLMLMPVPTALGRPGAPDWLVTHVHGVQVLFALDEDLELGRAVARALPVSSQATQWVTGDLFDGPGWAGWETWGADASRRRLRGLHRDGVEFDPQPSLEELRSVVQSLAIVDLDGDGSDELIVGVGAWWAYDVRVLSPERERPGRFELVARRKLGAVNGLVGLPAPHGHGDWIAVSLPNTPPSPRVFPSEARAGVPAGVYMLAWAGEGQPLDIVDRVALPSSFRPGAGDLDGDGRTELVVQMPTAIAVLRAGADDHYTPIWIDGLQYHALVDLDADGDDELIVSEIAGDAAGRLVVLGSGDQRVPLHDHGPSSSVEAPAELDHALAELWRQAEGLALIGLADPARSALADLARLASPQQAALAHRRAAEIDERHGAGRRAAELYERAGDRDSLARAVELDERSHEFSAAARVARQLASLDTPERARWRTRADTLDRLATPEHQLEFDFAEPLDPGWRIARAGLLRHEPGGLRVESMGSIDPILVRRAIVWTGGRLQIELDLDLLRLEWGSGLVIELVPVDASGRASGAPVASRGIGSWGGGDYYMLDLTHGLPIEPGAIGDSRVMRGAMPPLGQHRFRLAVDLLADAEQTWSRITTIDGAGPRDTAIEMLQPVAGGRLVPGRYELRLRTNVEPWTRGSIRLERLRVLGARDDPEAAPPTRREQVLLAATNGEHARALELLDQPDHADTGELDARDAAWLRALALEQLGRWPLAQSAIELAIGDCEGPDALARFGHAMLLQPDRLGPTLRRICPPTRFLLDTWAVTQVSLFQHKDLPDLHRTLTTQLVDLDRYEPADLDQALATMGLLTSRARGWLMQDVASAAESDLRRVIELSARWLDASDDVRRVAAIAHVELALVLMTRDRSDAAAAELERALIDDLAPEIIADLIVARGVVEPLEATALESTIRRAQLGLWRPNLGDER